MLVSQIVIDKVKVVEEAGGGICSNPWLTVCDALSCYRVPCWSFGLLAFTSLQGLGKSRSFRLAELGPPKEDGACELVELGLSYACEGGSYVCICKCLGVGIA